MGTITATGDYYGEGATSADIDLLVSNVGKLPNVAIFVWNEETGEPVYVSRQLPAFYRMPMAEFLEKLGTNDKIAANMVEDDGQRYLASMAGSGSYECEFRTYRSDGTICFAREVGEHIWDRGRNRVTRSVGAVIDITARKEAENALQISLEELRLAQTRLIQTEKLASLGQLTAGIAHEIKNPLNFVNNFAALSIELVGELRELLGNAALSDNARAVAEDVMALLSGNLRKVVQHGERADSIVRNMLLHSRHGSGEFHRTDVNAMVEESLNLAFHGARAQSKDFNVTIERQLDPDTGEADLFRQEIMRVLINVISNSFYALTNRASAADFERRLVASTRSLGSSVEIRICDNGTGIAPEVRDRIFDPFFTTKPPGEGTGLGLSLSHDIVVNQHGGTITMDTRPGEFCEFTIVLPRGAASSGRQGAIS